MRGGTPNLCFFCIPPFSIFPGIKLKLCLLSEIINISEILIICKDTDVVSVDMQPCVDTLVILVCMLM